MIHSSVRVNLISVPSGLLFCLTCPTGLGIVHGAATRFSKGPAAGRQKPQHPTRSKNIASYPKCGKLAPRVAHWRSVGEIAILRATTVVSVVSSDASLHLCVIAESFNGVLIAALRSASKKHRVLPWQEYNHPDRVVLTSCLTVYRQIGETPRVSFYTPLEIYCSQHAKRVNFPLFGDVVVFHHIPSCTSNKGLDWIAHLSASVVWDTPHCHCCRPREIHAGSLNASGYNCYFVLKPGGSSAVQPELELHRDTTHLLPTTIDDLRQAYSYAVRRMLEV